MRLPDWMGVMRRRPKDIKLKDFIKDDETKKQLVKLAAPAKKEGLTTAQDIIGYLREAKSVQEVMDHFGYGSLRTAYQAIKRPMQKGHVVALGHGLYVAHGDVIALNLGELSERELQERGLEALNNTMRQEDGRKANLPTAARAVTSQRTSKRLEAILDYLSEPRTSREVTDRFGYSGTDAVTPIFHKLAKAGLVEIISDTGRSMGSKPMTARRIGEATAVSEPQPEPVLPPTPAPLRDVLVPLAAQADASNLKQLAMEYLWTMSGGVRDILELTPAELLKDFVTWVEENR